MNDPQIINRCPNCQTALGCTCQLRTASNGQACCTSCLYQYEQSLRVRELIPHHASRLN